MEKVARCVTYTGKDNTDINGALMNTRKTCQVYGVTEHNGLVENKCLNSMHSTLPPCVSGP